MIAPGMPKMIADAREAITARIENGYTFDDFDTVESVTANWVECTGEYEAEPIERVTRAMRSALKFEGYTSPEKV